MMFAIIFGAGAGTGKDVAAIGAARLGVRTAAVERQGIEFLFRKHNITRVSDAARPVRAGGRVVFDARVGGSVRRSGRRENRGARCARRGHTLVIVVGTPGPGHSTQRLAPGA